jgi:anti-anti-sigma regulatory factor
MFIETRRQMVYVSGSLRSNQWEVIKTTALLTYSSYPGGVLIDFSGVRWVNSSGETTLVSAMEDIERHNLPFTLLNVASSVEAHLSTAISRRLAEGSEMWWKRLWGAT